MKTGAAIRRGKPRFVISAIVVVFVIILMVQAAVPHIDLIEPYINNQVLIHFDTEAKRAYTLQRCTSFVQTSNGISAVWSNIYFVPAEPYNDHYVAVDTNQTLPVRFYRLMATP
jgi:hypothetical protein